MELIAVTTVLGLLAAMTLPHFGHSTIANAGARGLTRTVHLESLRAQRRAISTGSNHYVKFTLSGPDATEYALYRRNGGGDVQIGSVHTVPANVTVTPSASEFEFDFMGQALGAYTCTVVAPDRNYLVTIIAATGKAIVSEF
jgi:hypothetical protein